MTEFDLKNYLYNNPLMEKKEDSKKGNKEMQKRMKGAIKDNEDHIDKLKKDIKADKKKLTKLKADEPKDVNESVEEGMDKEEKKLTKEGLKDIIKEKIISVLNEEEITEEELEEGNIDYDAGPKGFLKKEPNNWLTEEDIEEQEEEEFEEEEIIDDTEEEIPSSPVSGESAKVKSLSNLLTKAREEAEGFSSDPELGIQIGNVITYFTRQHVAGTGKK
tara:strand:+ start:149 stop:802 length:654 start_codon:yes stop_codon:yes gene_type:complete